MDEKTLQAARRGSRDALARLLRSFQDPWYRMGLALLDDADLAREAAQETAVRFLRGLRRFRGDSQLRTWALGICINVAREMRRARRCQYHHGVGEGTARMTVELPPQAAQRAEEVESLRDLLAQLPARQREALVLRYFEELSVEQTANAMRCAPGTVKATVHQALRALRRRMRQYV